MLIDFHTHAFPEVVAPGAIAKLAACSGGMTPQTDGTLASLRAEMKKDGVDISVVHAIATNPRQQTKVNDYAMVMNREDGIVAFGSVHPDAPNALEELERLAVAGLKGVKFHPEYQNFYADDPRMKPIYRKINELGLITLFHAGQDIGFAQPWHCLPEQMLGAKRWLEGPVVAAHWGGYACWQQVLDKLCGEEIFFDLSYGYGCIPRPIAQAIVEKHTPDRLLFASDMPWHRPAWEKRLIGSLDLNDGDREKIFWRNAARLLKLEP